MERRTGKIRRTFSRMHRALDGWMLAIARRLNQLKASTTMNLGISIFHFLYDVWPEKLGIVDQNWLEHNLYCCREPWYFFSTNSSRSVDGKLDENNSDQQVHTAVQQYIQCTSLCNHVA